MTSLCLTGVQILERKYCSLILAIALVSAMRELLWILLDRVELRALPLPCRAGRRLRPLLRSWDESVEGGLDDVVRVRRAEALGEHVLHAGGGHDGRTVLPAMTPVPSGAGLSMTWPAPKWPRYLVRNRALGQIDLVQILLGRLDTLADGLGDFLGLAGAVADDAFGWVADNDESGEGHVLPPLTTLVTRLIETTSSLRLRRFASIFSSLP